MTQKNAQRMIEKNNYNRLDVQMKMMFGPSPNYIWSFCIKNKHNNNMILRNRCI